MSEVTVRLFEAKVKTTPDCTDKSDGTTTLGMSTEVPESEMMELIPNGGHSGQQLMRKRYGTGPNGGNIENDDR